MSKETQAIPFPIHFLTLGETTAKYLSKRSSEREFGQIKQCSPALFEFLLRHAPQDESSLTSYINGAEFVYTSVSHNAKSNNLPQPDIEYRPDGQFPECLTKVEAALSQYPLEKTVVRMVDADKLIRKKYDFLKNLLIPITSNLSVLDTVNNSPAIRKILYKTKLANLFIHHEYLGYALDRILTDSNEVATPFLRGATATYWALRLHYSPEDEVLMHGFFKRLKNKLRKSIRWRKFSNQPDTL